MRRDDQYEFSARVVAFAIILLVAIALIQNICG